MTKQLGFSVHFQNNVKDNYDNGILTVYHFDYNKWLPLFTLKSWWNKENKRWLGMNFEINSDLNQDNFGKVVKVMNKLYSAISFSMSWWSFEQLLPVLDKIADRLWRDTRDNKYKRYREMPDPKFWLYQDAHQENTTVNAWAVDDEEAVKAVYQELARHVAENDHTWNYAYELEQWLTAGTPVKLAYRLYGQETPNLDTFEDILHLDNQDNQ